MRHLYANRVVLTVTVLLVLGSLLFAIVASQDDASRDRVADVLEVDADAGAGLAVYRDIAQPSCGACHTLAAAGASSDRASDLDVLRPSRRVVIASITSGAIRAHEAQGYRVDLSDRQLADLAAYVEEVAGREN